MEPTVWAIIFVLNSLITLLIMSIYATITEMVMIVSIVLVSIVWFIIRKYEMIPFPHWRMHGMILLAMAEDIVHNLGSIIKISGRMKDLGVEVAKLHVMQMALRRLDPLLCSEQCIHWLNSVDALQHMEQDIQVGYGRCGLNYSKRLHLSNKVCQELNTAYNLLRQGDYFLHPKINLQGTINFYTKKVIGFVNAIDADSGLLGIWGTGGVGKSCLLKLVSDSRSEYADGSLNVMFVHAGIGCTVSQVQQVIATSMGLSLMHNKTSHANIIRDHLSDVSFLLLLDDLCEYLDLEAVGIPLPLGSVVVSLQGGLARQKQRKVVLTTRNMNLCDKMGCSHDNTIKMECLDEEDAWKLYRRFSSVFIGREFTIEEKTLLPEILPVQRPSGCKTLQDDRFPGMAGSYNEVHYFIEDKGGRSLLLGVWGTRGVGKTTLLRLMRDYKGKAHFEHIMFVGAGTGCVVNNVQHAIAVNLGLDLAMMSSLDELSRAMHIFNYLEDKSFLLLLDDIREPLNWWAVGLPLLSYRGQKIILATRSQAACALMGCHPADVIEMRCLGKDDAWSLFKDKVGIGIINDHPQVHHLAKQMVSRCGGLPLALCALGRAMSNKKDLREWRSACSQLTAIGLEPCEIDEKVGSIIVDPLYGWRRDPIIPAEQTQGKSIVDHPDVWGEVPTLLAKQIQLNTSIRQEWGILRSSGSGRIFQQALGLPPPVEKYRPHKGSESD